MNGFDIDGVISIGIHPGKNDVIVTGRSYEETEETEKFLKRKGIDNIVFFNTVPFNEKTRESSGEHKARMINKLGITRFFEDDEVQYNIIRQKCPDVELVHVKSSLVELENVRRDEYGNEK